jgi:hypothetical protein
MDLGTNLIFLIIFGVAGFIIDKIWDFDPAEYWAKFGTASVGITLLLAYLPIVFNPEDIMGNVERLTNWFVAILPGTIIGDLAGQIVAEITGRGRR